MKAQKWDPKEKKYHPYKLPKGAKLTSFDMDEELPCASCGKKHKYGKMYTSKHIHTDIGFGYPVCEECYKKELEAEGIKW